MQDKYAELVLSFPSIRDYCPGIHDPIPADYRQPWNCYFERLLTWINGGGLSPGQHHAVAFCLNLRHPGGPGPAFDLFGAFNVWDRPHQQAFSAWAAKPWLP